VTGVQTCALPISRAQLQYLIAEAVRGGVQGHRAELFAVRVAMRPNLISTDIEFSTDPRDAAQKNTVNVYHLSQNAIEIKATKPIDLMVLLRT